MKKSYDYMDGHQFEAYCAKLLRRNGFHHVEVTRGSGDQGIDILAHKKRKKYGIQCKCYSYYLGNKSVQEAYAGMKFYECDVAAVLTNQYFTNSAIALAEKTEVLLWNRTVLEELRRCRKPFLLTLSGALCALLGGWLFYFLYTTENVEILKTFPGIMQLLFCFLMFLGGFSSFLEKGSYLLSLISVLSYGLCAVLGLIFQASLGSFSFLPLILFFFQILRFRKLKFRTDASL